MRLLGVVTREMNALADAAACVRTRDELRREVLTRLARSLGFDMGIIWTVPETLEGSTILGFPAHFWSRYYAGRASYAEDLLPMVVASARLDGVVNDRDVFNLRERERRGMYRDILNPIGARNFLTVSLGRRGCATAMMQVGRGGLGARFTEDHAAAMRLLRPVLALGEAMRDADPILGQEAFDLTPRERQIVAYLALGFTNREIGLALGSSMNTVRNQVQSIFRKADVCNRAELVRVSMDAGLLEPSSK
jgi:DNA-binding NarL/FixJ family response regulator